MGAFFDSRIVVKNVSESSNSVPLLRWLLCLWADSDVARGSYNIQQVQLAFAHAYHILCGAVRNDGTRCIKRNSTAEHFLCTDSILSHVVCMPHQHDLSCQDADFCRRKSTSSERKKLHLKRTTPHKKHKLSITRWFVVFHMDAVYWFSCLIALCTGWAKINEANVVFGWYL